MPARKRTAKRAAGERRARPVEVVDPAVWREAVIEVVFGDAPVEYIKVDIPANRTAEGWANAADAAIRKALGSRFKDVTAYQIGGPA